MISTVNKQIDYLPQLYALNAAKMSRTAFGCCHTFHLVKKKILNLYHGLPTFSYYYPALPYTQTQQLYLILAIVWVVIIHTTLRDFALPTLASDWLPLY
jgi:hypothetical protein